MTILCLLHKLHSTEVFKILWYKLCGKTIKWLISKYNPLISSICCSMFQKKRYVPFLTFHIPMQCQLCQGPPNSQTLSVTLNTVRSAIPTCPRTFRVRACVCVRACMCVCPQLQFSGNWKLWDIMTQKNYGTPDCRCNRNYNIGN